jgi:epoxyqueuosine reductase
MATCVSRLTTSNDLTDYDEATNKNLGLWIYSCDACQDVCPMNRGKWAGGDDFPGLEDIGARLLPEKILEMGYAEIERALTPKFFYIKSGSLWRWKTGKFIHRKRAVQLQ